MNFTILVIPNKYLLTFHWTKADILNQYQIKLVSKARTNQGTHFKNCDIKSNLESTLTIRKGKTFI